MAGAAMCVGRPVVRSTPITPVAVLSMASSSVTMNRGMRRTRALATSRRRAVTTSLATEVPTVAGAHEHAVVRKAPGREPEVPVIAASGTGVGHSPRLEEPQPSVGRGKEIDDEVTSAEAAVCLNEVSHAGGEVVLGEAVDRRTRRHA